MSQGACLHFCCIFDIDADFQDLCCLSRQQAAVEEESPEALRVLKQALLKQAIHCGGSKEPCTVHL